MATGGWFGVQRDRRTLTGGSSTTTRCSSWTATAWTSWPASAPSTGPASSRPSSARSSSAASTPRKRAQLGAHYTSQRGHPADRRAGADGPPAPPLGRRSRPRRWTWPGAATRPQTRAHARQPPGRADPPADRLCLRDRPGAGARPGLRQRQLPLRGPASSCSTCGKRSSVLAGDLGAAADVPLPSVSPSPAQLHGIEINPYAHELAQATIWIGYIQWLHENGFGVPARADPEAAGQHPADGRDPGLRRGRAARSSRSGRRRT